MAINEWKIWQKLKLAKEKETEDVKVKQDLSAVLVSLKEIDVVELVKKLETMKSMVKEEGIVEDGLKTDNLSKQIKQLDGILQAYSFLEIDVNINGLRLRKVGKELLRKASESGMKDVVKEKQKDMKWR
ncbi:hypothetical protein GOV03_01850 [Candidatus Woesearchaeota archaeon]|nr:hypothetical protein [Candidatus Woesearchaeota archaeon]